MKAYVYDTEDLKLDPLYQETWDDMIINFLAESLDVTQDADWVISLGNAFAKQYSLYTPNDDHAALLHRCMGILLQKVNDRSYVRDKIDWMYQQADISIPANRLGLAKAMGLVAASHLDTVLEKLKVILDNVGQSIFQRLLSLFSESYKTEDSDDIHAALALMYGYAAKYAPSSVIEARIDALVGTNMLSRLLHVRQQTAKQAVITAIDLLGRAVINASESGAAFPLKRRDQMLDFILTLMGRDENEGFAESSLELLHTQALALNACTTLVSVEPKLTVETRNRVMKATLGFFALPNDPSDVISPLIENLVTLLCAILLTSGEDGRSRAEQLLHLLRQLDQYVSSPIDYQRKRGCVAVHEMLLKFRKLCVGGYCSLGCSGDCPHRKYVDRSMQGNVSTESADPDKTWAKCRLNIKECSAAPMKVLHGFRSSLMDAIGAFHQNKDGGMFINSCYSHCQISKSVTWHSPTSPRIENKTIAESVADWYFNRQTVKLIDCPYPCNPSCYNMNFT